MKRRALLGLLAGAGTSGCLRLEQRGDTATQRSTRRTTAAATDTTTTTTTQTSTATTTEDATTREETTTETEEQTEEPTDGPVSLSPAWTHPDDIVTGVWTHDGTIYTSNESWLRKFAPDGTERFRTSAFPEDTYSQTAAFDAATAAVAVSTTSSATAPAQLVAYDADSGTTRWTHVAPDDGAHASPSDVAVGADTVVFATGSAGTCGENTARITALDEATGDERWHVDVDGECVNGVHVLADHVVAATTRRLLALDLATGNRTNAHEQYYGFGRFTAAGDALYGGYDAVEARSAPELGAQWRNRIPSELTTETTPLVDTDAVVAGTQSGELLAYERTGGDRRWRATMNDEIAALDHATQYIWASDKTGTVSAFDPATGDQFQRLDADSPGGRPLGAVDDTLLVDTRAYRIERN